MKDRSVHRTIVSLRKVHRSGWQDSVPNSKILLAEVIATRKIVFIPIYFRPTSCRGSKGLLVNAFRTTWSFYVGNLCICGRHSEEALFRNLWIKGCHANVEVLWMDNIESRAVTCCLRVTSFKQALRLSWRNLRMAPWEARNGPTDRPQHHLWNTLQVPL